MSHLLAIEKLYKVFDSKTNTVLSDINISIDEGEFVCILGPSGCGKTTLLNLIAGFDFPSQGKIKVNNKKIKGPGSDRCVVFQESTLLDWFTVEENIALGIRKKPKAEIRKKLQKYLDIVGLTNYRNYLPAEISGGMRQRANLARALIMSPRILLMDEPFSALDFQLRRELQDKLIQIQKKLNQTILFITHDVEEASRLADRVLIMGADPGHIREEIRLSLNKPRKISDPDFLKIRENLYNLFSK